MKICITSLGSTLDSSIDPRFGRAQYFLILDGRGSLKEALTNPATGAIRGAGVAAAQEISSKGVKVLITGNIGPNAFYVLGSTDIKVFLAKPGLTVKEAFSAWKEDKLTQLKKPTVSGHFGRGPGGMGRGRGRGLGPQRR